MNTTASIATTATTTDATTSASSREPSARTSWIRRAVVTLAALIGLTMSASVLTAAPANAATMASVTVCFDSSYHFSVHGLPWTGQVSYILYNPSTGRWQTQLRYASPNGCIRFSVYPGYATYFEVNAPYTGSSYLFARTPVYTYAGGYTYHLGWFKVIKVLSF